MSSSLLGLLTLLATFIEFKERSSLTLSLRLWLLNSYIFGTYLDRLLLVIVVGNQFVALLAFQHSDFLDDFEDLVLVFPDEQFDTEIFYQSWCWSSSPCCWHAPSLCAGLHSFGRNTGWTRPYLLRLLTWAPCVGFLVNQCLPKPQTPGNQETQYFVLTKSACLACCISYRFSAFPNCKFLRFPSF